MITLSSGLTAASVGYRSVVRDAVLGRYVKPISPVSSYNVDVPRSLLAEDPSLCEFLGGATVWLGHNRAIFAMNMPDYKDSFNMAMMCDGNDGEEGNWHKHADLNVVKEKFAGFDPRLQKILSMADWNNCYIWRLVDLPPLERWVSESGRVVLVGDAAHAVLPYSGAVSIRFT